MSAQLVYPFALPEYRYDLWAALPADIQSLAGTNLGYVRSTWNRPGTNSEEQKSYFTLDNVGKAGADGLGFSEEEWDCWVNHYDDYDWFELEDEEVEQYFEGLGWDEDSWNGLSSAPASEDKDWVELSSDEKQAAAGLCYLDGSWDGLGLASYTIPDYLLTPPTESPTEIINPAGSISTALSLVYPYDLPDLRYDQWSTLPSDLQTTAVDSLSYNETSWNTPGTNSEELKSYFTLDDDGKDGAEDLGFNEEEWDCWMNHYEDYDWSELIDEGVVEYFETLGWDDTSWIEEDESAWPESENAFWSELSADEKLAAAGVCFLEGAWDELELSLYNISEVYRYELPEYRYDPWSTLASGIQTIAEDNLGYDESSWNTPGTNSEESNAYSTLGEVGRAGVDGLDFEEEEWDCWVNHYEDYDWSELEDEAVVQFFETLGWDETSWEGDEGTWPVSENTDWEDLDTDEQQAAAYLCYLEATWDEEDISIVVVPDIIVVFDTLIYRFELPLYRYEIWSALSSDIQTIAEDNLSYDEASWNNPGTNSEELKSYSTLDDLGKDGANGLNFTEEEWDCWVNHYEDYDWSELIDEDVVEFFEILGWNETNWLGDSNSWPVSEDKFWSELYTVEQQAAANICFFAGTWDELPLTVISIPDITVVEETTVVQPPVEQCANIGQTCSADVPCCGSSSCIGTCRRNRATGKGNRKNNLKRGRNGDRGGSAGSGRALHGLIRGSRRAA